MKKLKKKSAAKKASANKKSFTIFEKKVFAQVRKIPVGKTMSYSRVARAIGAPNAARAVGNALSKSPGMPKVPCHRVVKSNGELGGFRWGERKKRELLEKEGVRFGF